MSSNISVLQELGYSLESATEAARHSATIDGCIYWINLQAKAVTEQGGFSRDQSAEAVKEHGTIDACFDYLGKTQHQFYRDDQEHECCVCMGTYAETSMVRVSCAEGHWVDRTCLKAFLEMKINQHEVGDDDITCPMRCPNPSRVPGSHCGLLFSPETIEKVIDDREMFQRFLDLRISKQFAKGKAWKVECPDCKYVAVVDDSRARLCVPCATVGCQYATGFCGLCQLRPHPGIDCDRARLNSEFGEVAESLGIKPCPTCGIYVERSEACKFMTCRCGQHFCILCGVKTTRGHLDDGHRCIQQGYAFLS
jgi:hypothetical protein